MNKIVRKVRPTNFWRIGEHESWLSDMSLQGLHLYKIGPYFTHFKKGEPKRMEYRIEVTKDKCISDEQIEFYEENGWDYITSYQSFHVFASLEENNALELHTDPSEQAFTLQQLNKSFILIVIGIALCSALISGMVGAIWFLDGTPVYQLVEGYVIQQSIACLFVLYYLYYATNGMLAIQALRRNLKEGKAINHHAPWKKGFRKNQVFTVFFIAIAFGSAALPWIQLAKSEAATLPEEGTNLPFVRLVDIEQDQKLVRGEEYMRDGVDWTNFYTTNWSPFAPVQYEMNENCVAEGVDGSDIYSPSIYSEVYQLTFNAFAKPLVSDLIKWNSIGDEKEIFVEKSYIGFDHLFISEEDEMKKLVAAKGNVVVYIRYFGYAEIEMIIEKAAEKLQALIEI